MAEQQPVNSPLSDADLDALRARHGKIAIVEWNGYAIVLRRPTRDECRAYRVALEQAETKVDANEQLCQRTIVALDAELDANKARTTFTGTLLEDCPMFGSIPRVKLALAALMGLVEDEDLADLGKGVSIRPLPPPRTLTV